MVADFGIRSKILPPIDGRFPIPYICVYPTLSSAARALHAARLPAHVVAKVERKLAEIHEREQESVSKERRLLQAKVDQLNEKERSLVNKYLENKLTDEIYETVREEISSERIGCRARLDANETSIQAAIRVLGRAVAFTRDLSVAYKRAKDPVKRQMLSVVFKEITVQNGGLEKVTLNEPFDFVCRDLPAIKNFSIKFDGEAFGDPEASQHELRRQAGGTGAVYHGMEWGRIAVFTASSRIATCCGDVLNGRIMRAITLNKAMTSDGENNISDVVQNLPQAAQRPADKPAGTVVTANGTRVTLGEEGHHNAAISSPQQGMKLVEK